MDTIKAVDTLDTERFMGTWYVIAHIPPFLTDDAFNAVERYRLNDAGEVDVLFTYNKGSFDGDLKTMTPTGFPDDGNAGGEWGMRVVWPFKADYRIAFLNDDYTETIIAREKRDYVWMMARSPHLPPERFKLLVQKIAAMNYDVAKLREVPQQPIAERQTSEVTARFDRERATG